MPIHDLGYRSWSGRLNTHQQRFWVIAQAGVRLAWRSMWLRRMLLTAWAPALVAGLMVFLFEQYAKNPDSLPRAMRTLMFSEAGMRLPITETLRGQIQESVDAGDIQSTRHAVWSWLLLTFFRYPQGILLVFLIGHIAPNLIAQDLRSRAYLIYFSRPITRLEYVLGKATVVFGYVMMITTVPALALYVLGVLLSPDLSVIWHTWDLPLRILAASCVLMVPTTSLALCFSSLTYESRYASFAWYAVWVLGWVAYANLTASEMTGHGIHSLDAAGGRWTLVSLYHLLGVVQTWVFGLEVSRETVASGVMILGIITVVSYAVLLNRVSAPMRI